MIDSIKTLINKTNELEDKINTLEDILEVEPSFPETVEITKKELDLTPLEDKIGDKEGKEIEEKEIKLEDNSSINEILFPCHCFIEIRDLL